MSAATVPVHEVRSTCCYCGVGCGVIIETDGQSVTGVRGDPDHPANHGALCSKGSTLHLTMRPDVQSVRLLHPEMRADTTMPRRRAGWDETLGFVADRFAEIIREHGPDAVAFYVSGQLLTEDYYVFNKLAKGLVGTNNIDTNSRLCMSSAVAGYKQSLGADAPPCAYADIDAAQCLFIAGSNTAIAHPILYRRIERARAARPDLKVIVVDPRVTDTAREADLHLQILPGTDVALFHGMLHVMLWEGLLDHAFIRDHTEGFEALKSLVREYTPKSVAQTCGIAEADLVRAATWFGAPGATLSLYCQGLNQSTSGTAKNTALINLHLATGHIGRPGSGPFSLTGQPNAMGGREVGGLANLLSAHRDLGNAEHRAEVARAWGVADVPAAPGKTAVELFDALHDGSIKAVWIACTNPAQSMPDQRRVHEALRRAELVVVQEAYRDTETAWYADVLLPATSWAEKDGTVTNSERRISRVRRAVSPPGQARDDWAIVVDFARCLEARLRPGATTLFPYADACSVWNEHRALTAGRDLDITGLSYDRLETAGPAQWPYPAGAASGRARLYVDGVFPTPNGRARFVTTPWQGVKEPADARYPFRLTTARLRDQWHGMSRTGSIGRLFGNAPEPLLGMHPGDLLRRGLDDGALVRVQSRRGVIHVRVSADQAVRPGQACLPMHWGARFLTGGESLGVNTLTSPAFDPVSKQPELKAAAVRIERAVLPWRFVACALPAHGAAIALADALAPTMRAFEFASLALVGAEPAREGVVVRLAALEAPDRATLDDLDRRLGLAHAHVIRYEDARRQVGRRIDVADGRLRAFRLSGHETDIAAASWLQEWLVRGEPVAPVRRFLLAPTSQAPAGVVRRGRTVCACLDVTDSAIGEAATRIGLDGEAGVRAVCDALRCGTNCGSCMPEVRRLVGAVAREVVA